ncbi:MAG: hypothetical protein ABIQ16_03015 [Polyangiaceae bacterium]
MKIINWLNVTIVCAGGSLALLAACAGRRLPPGTPPPEYEAPLVVPWTPDSGEVALPKSAEHHADPALPPAAGAELSLDAGQR